MRVVVKQERLSRVNLKSLTVKVEGSGNSSNFRDDIQAIVDAKNIIDKIAIN
ncbi:hypothetical protein [Mucilaginibacter sp. UYCu711]|uniref:hypothetical protein n=1 Tax=Mucilaginibacter sp. UYCu711 TaxID=3156339 RepID=UPI003D1E9755